MKELFRSMITALQNGEDLVLCGILASSGSAPRGAGARMAVYADGHIQGTIGGGSVEMHAINIAREVLHEESSLVKEFVLTSGEVEDIGMICGGRVTVYFQPFSASGEEHLQWLRDVYRMLDGREEGWIIYLLEHNQVEEAALYTREGGLRYEKKLTLEQIQDSLGSDAVMLQGEPAIYLEPLLCQRRVLLFGGGHVGRALVPVLHAVNFSVVVYDNREALAVRSEFPLAEDVIYGDYQDISRHVQIRPKDYVVIMSPGHQADFELLDQVLRTEATYIGCIGSHKKAAAARQLLLEKGHSLENIQRIHSPIGLKIHAETPEEIAISIAGEMIEHRATKDGLS